MTLPPPVLDKSASSAHRKWLARRRCVRALRATLACIVLVTPFLYFGYVLCCNMPFNISRTLPNWILLYEFWMLLRNTYIFFRYVWKTPLWAALPLIVNIYFIIYYPPGPNPYEINEKLYFELFKKERMEVIDMIEKRTFDQAKKQSDFIYLKQPYTHLAMQNGLVIYTIHNNRASVIFATGWDLTTLDIGLCYIPDDLPAEWLRMGRMFSIEKISDHWYRILPQFGYLRSILRTPEDEDPENNLSHQ